MTGTWSFVRPFTPLRGQLGDGAAVSTRAHPHAQAHSRPCLQAAASPVGMATPCPSPPQGLCLVLAPQHCPPCPLLSLPGWHAWPAAAQGDAGAPGGLRCPRGSQAGCVRGGPDSGPSWSRPQATRTPSRSEAGLELLAAYYNQLCLLDARFVTPARSLGLLFHW